MSVLLIDTNLWSYLGKETDPDALADLFREAGHEAVINSLMLSEALETGDVGTRTQIVTMMCSRHWRKLLSPIDAHAVELTSEVRRLRPEWLRSIPKTDRLHSFRDYWNKVYWREAKTDPEAVIARAANATAHDDAAAEIVRVQTANKATWPFLDGDFASAGLAANMVEDHPDPDPGARLGWPEGTPVLLWRISARDVYWAQMGRELGGRVTGYIDRTMSDFLGAYVDLAAMRRDRESFNRFFLFDIEGWNVPRTWWQGTVEVLQLGKKLGTGNGADATHASYLPDCDYLLTTDKRFADVLQAAAETPGAPKGGAVVHVREDPNGWVEALKKTLAHLPPPRIAFPTRVVPAGPMPRIGDGPGEVSASEVRRQTQRNRPSAVEARARLLADNGAVVADEVDVKIVSDPELRPEGMKADYFGAMKIVPRGGADGPIAVGTKYVLEWIDVPGFTRTRIWVGEVEDDGVLASFAVNGRL